MNEPNKENPKGSKRSKRRPPMEPLGWDEIVSQPGMGGYLSFLNGPVPLPHLQALGLFRLLHPQQLQSNHLLEATQSLRLFQPLRLPRVRASASAGVRQLTMATRSAKRSSIRPFGRPLIRNLPRPAPS